MKNAVIKPVSEFAEVVTGGTPSTRNPDYWDGEIPWLNSGALNEGDVTAPSRYITKFGLENSSAKLMPRDTVLIALTGATTGQVGYLCIEASANQSVTGILPSKEHHPRYLYYFLKSQRKKILGDTFGGGQPHINQKYVKDFKVPLPLIDDQKRIAHLLGKVDGLIAQRKQHLQQLDDLLKSVFLEMFGDPVRNEKGWEKKPLEKLGSVNRGVSKHRPRNAPVLLGGKYPLIQTGEVSNAGTYITSYTHTYSDIGFAQSKLWPAGTLCITIAANIAQTGVLTFDACFPDSVVGFIPYDDQSHVLYVHGLFWFFQAILEKNAPAAAQKNINLEILRTLEVPKPPIVLQNQFAAIVEKVEVIKSHYQQSLTTLENLYGALSQKAFKGELDLSHVPLPVQAEPKVYERKLTDTVDVNDQIKFNEYLMSDPQERKKLLRSLFETYLEELEGKPLSLEDFWQQADSKTTDLMSVFDNPWNASDYDQLKDWLFERIRDGRLEQTFVDETNKIQLKVKA